MPEAVDGVFLVVSLLPQRLHLILQVKVRFARRLRLEPQQRLLQHRLGPDRRRVRRGRQPEVRLFEVRVRAAYGERVPKLLLFFVVVHTRGDELHALQPLVPLRRELRSLLTAAHSLTRAEPAHPSRAFRPLRVRVELLLQRNARVRALLVVRPRLFRRRLFRRRRSSTRRCRCRNGGGDGRAAGMESRRSLPSGGLPDRAPAHERPHPGNDQPRHLGQDRGGADGRPCRSPLCHDGRFRKRQGQGDDGGRASEHGADAGTKGNLEIEKLRNASINEFKTLAKEQTQKILISKIGQAQKFGGGIGEFTDPQGSGEGLFSKVIQSTKGFDKFQGQQADFRFDYKPGSSEFKYGYGAAQTARQEMAPEYGRAALDLTDQLQAFTGYTPNADGKAVQAGEAGLKEFYDRQVKELQTVAKDSSTPQIVKDEINAALKEINKLGGTKNIAKLQVAQRTGALTESGFKEITGKFQNPVLQSLQEQA